MNKKSAIFLGSTVMAAALLALARPAVPKALGQNPSPVQWKIHDMSRPRPPVITPGSFSSPHRPGRPPSDAVVLFDGRSLDAWESVKGGPAPWKVEHGYFEVVPHTGDIRTKQRFGNFQLHVEWAEPYPPHGSSQGRGNSGIFLQSLYELQVLDSYHNPTYADGQCGAIYGDYPPLVNACRPPGQWQTYDIVFHRPLFDASRRLLKRARVTVFQNGVLIQDNVAILGPTHGGRHPYHYTPARMPLELQDHHNPVRYRNIWIRELKEGGH